MYNHQIQTFIYAAELGSFSKAAEKLFTTPASIMNQINSLEARIGIKLLERTNQGIKLTPGGYSIYKDAKHIIEESEKAVSRAKKIAGTEQRIIRVGTSLLNPCKTLIDLWNTVNKYNSNFQIKIVPFEDKHTSILSIISSLGKKIDFLAGPCSSNEWLSRCNFLPLGKYKVCCAVSQKHRLSKKKILNISDLYDENLMMVKQGDSKELDILRNELEEKHQKINILDTSFYYDADVFNACEISGNILLTLDTWAEVHPSLVTIPVDWNYTIPYGLLYAKTPSKDVLAFLEEIKNL